MTDPKRWSDGETGVSPLEQSLVRTGQDVAMPAELKARVWSQIACSVGAPATPNAVPSGSGASSGSQLLAPTALKALSIVAVLVGAGATGQFVVRGSTQKISTAPMASLSTGRPAAWSAAMALAAHPPQPLDVRSTRSQPTSVSSASESPNGSHASQLREESQAVLAARQALASNDPMGALRVLEQARRRFKIGVLTEEREALTIEALARSSNRARASDRAKAFLRAYPRSPHAADVQRHVAE